MNDQSFKDYFSDDSNAYATYRPLYPNQLVSELCKLCKNKSLALDYGCGTGQLSTLLATEFHSVIGIDASQSQIDKAEKRNNIQYKIALAENTDLSENSADLITVAQAAHWLDLENFYKEVIRVAKPNAVLALISYGVLYIEDDSLINQILQDFYYKTIKPYWPEERKHVENGYRDLPFPFQACSFPTMHMEAYWNLDELTNYCSTWSAVKKAEQIVGISPIHQLKIKLRTQWGSTESKKKITWPLSVKLGFITK